MEEKKVDHDWKKRARAEKEKLAQEAERGGKGAGPAGPVEASFALIVSSFHAQALIALGDLESPVDGQRKRDLEAAKFSIDLLQALEDKTRGNLTDDEQRMLHGSLYELRMRYVNASS